MNLREVLGVVGKPAVSIDHSACVEDAISLMSQTGAESLIVMRGGSPAGIFTKHDIANAYSILSNQTFLQMPLDKAMTNKVITAAPEDTLDSSISFMLKAKIRHLPVMEGGTVVAMMHLCDLLNYKLEELSSEMENLEHYVKDLHGAMTD